MVNSITKAETPSVSPAFAKQLLAAVRAIKDRFHKWQDERLAQRLIERLYTLEEWQWIPAEHTFNSWKFPLEFYDLIPKWWKRGMKINRAMRVISPVMDVVHTKFGRKEELRYHNVHKGKMTNDEFEFWYNLDRNGNNLSDYYDKRYKVEQIKWWDEETFKKLSELNVW